MPVLMAVGLIIAKGLMDLATATSARGEKGDRGSDGAPGPQGMLFIQWISDIFQKCHYLNSSISKKCRKFIALKMLEIKS